MTKKIINGKLYDTETAKFIGYYDNGCGGRDFRHMSEELYLKKTGEFFQLGEGGPLSKYSEERGNNTCGISKIIPLTENEAKKWAEE